MLDIRILGYLSYLQQLRQQSVKYLCLLYEAPSTKLYMC
jgi:hypothetical protein